MTCNPGALDLVACFLPCDPAVREGNGAGRPETDSLWTNDFDEKTSDIKPYT
jgi:hypothetical protein